jgi:hypothetical protein
MTILYWFCFFLENVRDDPISTVDSYELDDKPIYNYNEPIYKYHEPITLYDSEVLDYFLFDEESGDIHLL